MKLREASRKSTKKNPYARKVRTAASKNIHETKSEGFIIGQAHSPTSLKKKKEKENISVFGWRKAVTSTLFRLLPKKNSGECFLRSNVDWIASIFILCTRGISTPYTVKWRGPFFWASRTVASFFRSQPRKFGFSPLEAIAQVSHKFRKAFSVPMRSAGQRKIYT